MASPFENFTDPTTTEGRKLWELAIEPLKHEFDGTRASYGTFRAGLRNKVKLCRWQGIVMFPDPSNMMANINLIGNADLIPMEDIGQARDGREALAIASVRAADPANGVEAITQDQIDLARKQLLQSNCMHECLSNSLAGTIETFIASKQNQGMVLEDGPTLLKMIQTKCRGKAIKQSVANVRSEIRTLNLKEFKFNITKFNERLKELINFLVQNEEPCLPQDVANMVVENHKMVTHDEFKSAIEFHFRDLEQKDLDVDYEALLDLGESKYQHLVTKKTWGKKTAQEEQLLALQAKVNQLESARKPKGTSSGDASTPSSNTKKKKNKKKATYEPWQFEPIPGKTKLTKEREINGEKVEVVYCWCPHHGDGKGMWVRHKPTDCNNANKSGNNKSKGDKPKLVASQVVIDEEEDQE